VECPSPEFLTPGLRQNVEFHGVEEPSFSSCVVFYISPRFTTAMSFIHQGRIASRDDDKMVAIPTKPVYGDDGMMVASPEKPGLMCKHLFPGTRYLLSHLQTKRDLEIAANLPTSSPGL
jgi:hypothetical protein